MTPTPAPGRGGPLGCGQDADIPTDPNGSVDHLASVGIRWDVLVKIIGKSWGNHRKIIGKIMAIIMTIFGNFMVNLYLDNRFKGLIDFFRFILV